MVVRDAACDIEAGTNKCGNCRCPSNSSKMPGKDNHGNQSRDGNTDGACLSMALQTRHWTECAAALQSIRGEFLEWPHGEVLHGCEDTEDCLENYIQTQQLLMYERAAPIKNWYVQWDICKQSQLDLSRMAQHWQATAKKESSEVLRP